MTAAAAVTNPGVWITVTAAFVLVCAAVIGVLVANWLDRSDR